jgi:NAD(P)-dependent dehydrogenase (short-subunit alcohol dehydrogenase family)
MQLLAGRTAVVTGAASGIGLATVEAFVAEGMHVVMTDVDEVRLGEHAQRLAQAGGSVLALPADVRDPGALERVGQAAVEQFGALHVAVNNAGIVVTGNSWELPLEEWRRVVEVDLWGVIHGVHAFVPLILASGAEGHVVNTASMAAVYAPARLGPYAVSKHGVLALSDVLRAELAALEAPVGVSVVMPGMIKTGMNPLGTVTAETVAANIVDAIRQGPGGRPYVFTDDHHTAEVDARLRAIIAARAGRLS